MNPADKPRDQGKQGGSGPDYVIAVREVSGKVTKSAEVMNNYHTDMFVKVVKPLIKL